MGIFKKLFHWAVTEPPRGPKRAPERKKSREELIREAMEVRAKNKDIVWAGVSDEERERFVREAFTEMTKKK